MNTYGRFGWQVWQADMKERIATESWEPLLPEIFEFVHQKMEEMSLDVMNWQLSSISGWLQTNGVAFERENFKKLRDTQMIEITVRVVLLTLNPDP